MPAKLTMLILGLGLLAALLLVNRQRRYEIVGERIRVHAHLERLQREVQEMKVRVADVTQASEIQRLTSGLGVEWRSIGDRVRLFEGTWELANSSPKEDENELQ